MPIIEQGELYQFVRFRVAGVTQKNGRRSRQTILRRIFWKDEPYHKFDGEKDVGLRLTEFDGQPAVEVWVRGKEGEEQIGWMPKDELPNVVPRMERFAGVSDFAVYGGGETPDGEPMSFGATMTVRFVPTDEEKAQWEANRSEKDKEAERRRKENDRQREEAAERARVTEKMLAQRQAEQRQAEERRQKEEAEKQRQKKLRRGTLAALIVILILLKLLLK